MEAYEAILTSGLVYMRLIYPYEAIYSSGLVYMMMIYQWIPQCDDLQFIRKGRVARCDKSRIWNVGLSYSSTTFWSATRRACLYLLFYGAIMKEWPTMEQFWFGVPSWPERNSGGMWFGIIEWFLPTKAWRHWLHTWCHECAIWRNLELLREWEQERFDWFWQMWNIQSESFLWKVQRNEMEIQEDFCYTKIGKKYTTAFSLWKR